MENLNLPILDNHALIHCDMNAKDYTDDAKPVIKNILDGKAAQSEYKTDYVEAVFKFKDIVSVARYYPV